MIDRLIGLICALLGAGAIWHAQTLHVPFAADPVGPRVFPTITGGVLILGGFILMLRPGAERVARLGAVERGLAGLAVEPGGRVLENRLCLRDTWHHPAGAGKTVAAAGLHRERD